MLYSATSLFRIGPSMRTLLRTTPFALHVTLRTAFAAFFLLPVIGCASSSSSSGTTTGGGGGSGGGGSTGTPSSSAPFSTGTAKDVYVVQNAANGIYAGQLLEFAVGSNGATTPVSTLTTNLDIESIVTDNNGQIYVTGYTAAAALIEVFPSGSTGTPVPTRTINLSGYAPTAMACDSANLLYTVDANNTVNVYSATASGAATPLRSLAGSATGLGVGLAVIPAAITVDAAGNIYVATHVQGSVPSRVVVFPSSASGNVAPSNTINYPVTYTGSEVFSGLAIDPSGNLYAALDTVSSTGVILEYAAGANGTPTPIKTIGGTSTGLNGIGGIRSDASGNFYVEVENSTAPLSFSLLVFPPAATGNVAPAQSITSSAWTNSDPQIALY
jgi:hypothetical protein